MSEIQITELASRLASGVGERFWVLLIVQAIVAFLAALFGSYLAQKGKNRADREDIRRLTELVEDVKGQTTIRTKLHEKVRERQIEALVELYAHLDRMLTRAQQRAKPSRFANEDEEALVRGFYAQGARAVEVFSNHSLLFPEALRNQVDLFFRETIGIGINLDVADSMRGTQTDLSHYFNDAGNGAFEALPSLLKEIRATAKRILESEQVEL